MISQDAEPNVTNRTPVSCVILQDAERNARSKSNPPVSCVIPQDPEPNARNKSYPLSRTKPYPCLVWEKTRCVANRTPCYHNMQNPMPVTNRSLCLVCDITRCKTYLMPLLQAPKSWLFVCVLCALTPHTTFYEELVRVGII